jgi:hypothetical protein
MADRHGLTTGDLAAELGGVVGDFHRCLGDYLPPAIALPLAVSFGQRLLAVMLDEAFGPARDTPPREEEC